MGRFLCASPRSWHCPKSILTAYTSKNFPGRTRPAWWGRTSTFGPRTSQQNRLAPRASGCDRVGASVLNRADYDRARGGFGRAHGETPPIDPNAAGRVPRGSDLGRTRECRNRVISGSVFSGRKADDHRAFLGRYHQQITALEEGTNARFWAGSRPAWNFSPSRIWPCPNCFSGNAST